MDCGVVPRGRTRVGQADTGSSIFFEQEQWRWITLSPIRRREPIMTIRPIIRYPDPRLAIAARPDIVFDDALRELAKDLRETMHAAPGIVPGPGRLCRHHLRTHIRPSDLHGKHGVSRERRRLASCCASLPCHRRAVRDAGKHESSTFISLAFIVRPRLQGTGPRRRRYASSMCVGVPDRALVCLTPQIPNPWLAASRKMARPS